MSVTTLSELQYPMMREFMDRARNYVMSIEEAMALNQITFGSMLRREYVIYKPGWRDQVGYHKGGFVLAQKGRDVWHRVHQGDRMLRHNPHLPLTSYFDPAVYGLDMPETKPKGKAKVAGKEPGSNKGLRLAKSA